MMVIKTMNLSDIAYWYHSELEKKYGFKGRNSARFSVSEFPAHKEKYKTPGCANANVTQNFAQTHI